MLFIMEESWKKNAKFFLVFLIAGSIVYCLLPTIKVASSYLTARIFPERALSVKIFSVGKNGGSEMWLSTSTGSHITEKLKELPSISNYTGVCEYRKAEEYGYACDFLVSYGDNVGSTFEITYIPMADSRL